ncbi:MAG: PAS domain S-box protein, partial [Ignavibacteria bacterium]|nr:PAS domain S-box protein [Ignavibacteria bacterium]
LSEIKLKEDEELFRAISNLTSDYLFSTNFSPDGKLIHTWVGGAFEKLTGYTLEEYREIGGWRSLIHPDDFAKDEAALQKIMNNENVISELRTIHKNGNIIWVRIYAKPVWDYEQNKLIAVQGAVQDITERRRDQLIQQIQYNIANAITSSIKTFELFDIVRKELSQLMNTKNFFVAFYDEKTNTLTSDLDKDEKDEIGTWSAEKSLTGYLIKSKKTLLLTRPEILKLHNSGTIELVGTLPEAWLGSPLKIGNKTIGAVVVQSYDDAHAYDESSLQTFEVIANQLSVYIQRKRTEEELSILARAIYQTPLSIVVTDTSGNIVYVNPSFEKVSGYSKEEVLGQNIRILSSNNHELEFYKNLWDTILTGKDWEGEILNKNKKGELYWEHQIISPVINDDGITTHFIALKEDVTEKKKMIQEIIDAKERAEASEKLKTEFLAQISHEIRTPINIMTSNFQLIKDEVEDKIEPEFLELFSSISRASHRIIRTVDLILNMSELQTGAYQPNMKKIDLDKEILQSLQIEYLHLAQSKKIELTYRSTSKNPVIVGDEYSVMQIFANLIDNAIKYTDYGRIEINLFETNTNEKIVEVKDSGIGMSKEFLSKVFQPFVQEEHGYTRSYEGNGLGLALVKNYCSINDAVIEVESEKGVGSTFRVKFKNSI